MKNNPIVVLSNSNSCRIYSYNKAKNTLVLIQEINHPELRLKASVALTNDKPGRYQTRKSARGAYSPNKTAKEIAIEQFAKEIAAELDKHRKQNLFSQVIFVVDAHMSGLITKQLNTHVKNLITNYIHKDLNQFSERELLEVLKTEAQYADES